MVMKIIPHGKGNNQLQESICLFDREKCLKYDQRKRSGRVKVKSQTKVTTMT